MIFKISHAKLGFSQLLNDFTAISFNIYSFQFEQLPFYFYLFPFLLYKLQLLEDKKKPLTKNKHTIFNQQQILNSSILTVCQSSLQNHKRNFMGRGKNKQVEL